MPKGLHRPKASCHPERDHYGLGLCLTCWRRKRYIDNPEYREKQRESARIYRRLNEDKARQSSQKYYVSNRLDRIAKAHEWYKSNPERARNQRREYYLANRERISHKARLKRVGLTESDYDSLLIKQKGVCVICKKGNNGRPLVPDHCHKTGVVRGLLCSACNSGIGLLQDNVEILESALLYLKQPCPTQGKVIQWTNCS